MNTAKNSPAKLHRLTARVNGFDSFGYVTEDAETGIKYFRIGSASGPMGSTFSDRGPLAVKDALILAYNYETDEYANRYGWGCIVERINRKSVTVISTRTGATVRIPI